MKSSRRLLWMTSLPVCAAALFLATRTKSEPPPAPSASASASAPELPLLRGADIPADKSDKPKEKEWASGKKVRPLRDESGYPWSKSKPCTFTLIREWLRVHCTDRVGANLVAGDKTDVTIIAGGHPFGSDGDWWPPGTRGTPVVLITTRLERNQTRLFSILDVRGLGDYGLAGLDTAESLAIVWREGREDPYIVLGPP
jgi:hypothetical protein